MNSLGMGAKASGLILLFVTLSCVSSINAQLPGEVPLHDFSDRKSGPQVCGSVVSYTDEAIQVKDGLGIIHVLAMKSISLSDQKFVKSLKTAHKNWSKQKEEANELFDKLGSGTSKAQIKILNRIAKIGPAASALAPNIGLLAEQSDETQLAASALQSFIAICPRKDSISTILRVLKAQPEIVAIIKEDPRAFFESLVRLGPYGETILITTAFTGEVNFASKKEPKEPTAFPTVNGPKNLVRATACFSLAQIKTAKSMNASRLVLRSAEVPVNGQVDTRTISQLFLGSAIGGRTIFGDWAEAVTRYKKKMPRETGIWIKHSKINMEMSIENSRLVALSKLRRFSDSNGKFLLRGNFESFSDGLVLITDENKNRVAIEFDRFSTFDKSWIEESTQKNNDLAD